MTHWLKLWFHPEIALFADIQRGSSICAAYDLCTYSEHTGGSVHPYIISYYEPHIDSTPYSVQMYFYNKYLSINTIK